MSKFHECVMIVVSVALLVGCNAEKSQPDQSGSSTNATTDHSENGHSHDEGPHGGTVADWGGGKFHVEFTVDHDKQEATVYLLGDDAKSAAPVDAPEITLAIKDPALTTTLKASPQEGDPEGKSSRFVGTHEGLGVVQEYEGTVSGVVGGTPYSGTFKEEAHDH